MHLKCFIAKLFWHRTCVTYLITNIEILTEVMSDLKNSKLKICIAKLKIYFCPSIFFHVYIVDCKCN